MRLIDCHKAKRAIYQHKTQRLQKETVLKILDRAPTIDAVEVVRCKDCIYRYKESDEGYICGISGDFTGDNEVCCKGKREDKGNEN